MSDFKERFGLDYLYRSKGLVGPSVPASSSAIPAGLEDALIAYGGKLLGILSKSPDKSLKVFDLAKAADLRIDTLLPVLSYMAEKNMVERTEVDSLGNDTYRLSSSGERLSA
jgi:hypothetical protein